VESAVEIPVEPPESGSARLRGQKRMRLVAICFTASFLAICGQLGYLAVYKNFDLQRHLPNMSRVPAADIVDRNGQVLATDISLASLCGTQQDYRCR
jgi:cell division protein FtsI/penicillin-binding protein 2